MRWGSLELTEASSTPLGVAANDNKYSAAEAKTAWTKLRDDNFAQAPWFKK